MLYFMIGSTGKNTGGAYSFEELRYKNFQVLSAVGLPIMLLYGLFTLLYDKDWPLLFLIIYCILVVLVCLVFIPITKYRTIFYHLIVLSFGAMLFYMLATGGPGGSRSLWMYTYPLVTFFLLRKNQGGYFNIVTFISIVIVFINPLKFDWVFPYMLQYKVRFVVTYSAVFSISFWFAYNRNRFDKNLEEKQSLLEEEIQHRRETEKELRAALEEVNTLSGFLPICSSCKKIRDDSGYWSQIEHYIQHHSDAVFSHSLCPDCAKKLYPDYAGRFTNDDNEADPEEG